ncbi:LysE family translocator [Rhizobium sp. YIM 134829]|uniref:LysE family translocator n=1 Tax=Rhizobium sp. YIM 134829 TaxID=3390453 RepID=UPI00397B70E3
MSYAENLWLFLTLLIGIIIVPGMDMIFVMANALTGGRRAGFMALGGIVAGGVVHTLYAALGVGALVHFAPGLFNGLLAAGAAYIAWIGLSLLRSHVQLGAVEGLPPLSDAARFRRGVITCLLNPKAYLFMLAVYPQFVKPEFGSLWSQAATLALMIAAVQIAIYGTIALAAGRSRALLTRNPKATALLGRAVGALLIAVAVTTAFEAWRMA